MDEDVFVRKLTKSFSGVLGQLDAAYNQMKMECLVEAIEEQTRINPTNKTNYSDLPMELKLACMKYMDLRTVCRLGRTSKMEKSLVDESNLILKKVLIMTGDTTLKVRVWDEEREYEASTSTRPVEDVLEILFSILKRTSSIHNLQYIEEGKNFAPKMFLDELKKLPPIKISRLGVLYQTDMEIPIALIELSSRDLENITVYQTGVKIKVPWKTFINLPRFVNSRSIDINLLNGGNYEVIKFIAQKWIETDAPIGRSIECVDIDFSLATSFAQSFGDRLIDHGENFARIRMDGNKHIACKLWFPVDPEEGVVLCKIVKDSEVVDFNDLVFC